MNKILGSPTENTLTNQQIIHLVYYGKDLSQAFNFCFDDRDVFESNHRYNIISAKLLMVGVSVDKAIYGVDKAEAWEFECFLYSLLD